jgi:hypothetical protein
MDADRKTNYRLYTVSGDDKAKLKSPYVENGGETDAALNNLLSLNTESVAVLQTATGTWLIVKPEMADLYIDMMKLAGKGKEMQPVYGYVREGVRPLLVIKAPANLSLPECEEGFFRTN